jgi:hypothetical protein
MDLNAEERDVILAALFELRVTQSAFDDDPNADRIPIARISRETIDDLVVKLDGELDNALFGAFRDSWADVEASAPEYPADETDEG